MKTVALTSILCLSSVAAFAPPANKATTSLSLSVLPDGVDLAAELATTVAAASDSSSDSLASVGALAAGSASFGPAGIVAGAGIFLAGAAVAVGKTLSSKDSTSTKVVAEPEPEPIDVSIPYNAAAALAYSSLTGTSAESDPAAFATFEGAYEKFTVAEVSFKKAAREYEAVTAPMAKASEE